MPGTAALALRFVKSLLSTGSRLCQGPPGGEEAACSSGSFRPIGSRKVTSADTSDCATKQTRSQNLRLREGGAGCWVGRRQVAHTCQREDFAEEGPSGPLGWKGILQMEVVEGLRMQQSTCPLCLSAQAHAPSLSGRLQDPPSSSKAQSRQSTL